MPRTARAKSASGIYHIIMRGNNRQKIFADNQDRQKLLHILGKYKTQDEYRIFAYCLMDNHIHMLMQELQEDIGTIIKRISSSYVYWYNYRYELCGHLFQDRFKSEPVDSDSYFFTVLRYIHQNPVKANIVDSVEKYKWSSYGEYLGQSKYEIVDKDFVLKIFSDNHQQAIRQFVNFVTASSDDICLEDERQTQDLSDEMLIEIVESNLGFQLGAIKSEPRVFQDKMLREIKKIAGVNIRQLARITELPATRIWRT